MNKPIRTTILRNISAGKYRVTEPVTVRLFKEADGSYRAAAPELGMWIDGRGMTEEEALQDLSMAIVEQRDSANQAEGQCSNYARTIRNVFLQRFVKV